MKDFKFRDIRPKSTTISMYWNNWSFSQKRFRKKEVKNVLNLLTLTLDFQRPSLLLENNL